MHSAQDFTIRLQDLLRRERVALADFLVALADFDRRRLWIELGHASLFYFLHRELGLSKGAAFYRKTAAELIQQFPELIEPLRDGRLCLTSIVELAKVITAENREEVLPRFFHMSKREAKEVSAALRPVEATPLRDVVRTARAPQLPLAGPDPAQSVHPANRHVEPETKEDRAVLLTAPAPMAPPTRVRTSPDTVEPLTSDASRLHVTVSRAFLKKLEAARAALSHAHPGAGAQEILEAGLDLLLARHARRRGLVQKPRREPPPCKTDRVPAHVSRAVWERDGGRCQWKLASGGICGSTLRVELDHVTPRARGGQATVDNLRILCDVHNDLAARHVYGDAWMDRFTRGRRGRTPSDVADAPRP